VTVSLLDAITYSTDTTGERTRFVKRAVNDNYVLGVVVGFGEKEGGKVYKSFKGASSVTTAADNVTNAKIGVWYIPAADQNAEFIADVDADLGTTPGSTGAGHLALADAGTLAENSYVVVGGTGAPKDFNSYGRYNGEPRKVVGRFAKTF
jgi:hypothetical protein